MVIFHGELLNNQMVKPCTSLYWVLSSAKFASVHFKLWRSQIYYSVCVFQVVMERVATFNGYSPEFSSAPQLQHREETLQP